MKQKHIKAFMKTAETFAECSTAKRLHVGAIIVKDDRIISIGYNGMPSGWVNDCEFKEYHNPDLEDLHYDEIDSEYPFLDTDVYKRYRLCTKPEVLHAESNAIAKLAKSSESGLGSTLFVTHSPCMDCAKLIYQSGISSVYYRNSYRSVAGLNFLEKSGVQVNQI